MVEGEKGRNGEWKGMGKGEGKEGKRYKGVKVDGGRCMRDLGEGRYMTNKQRCMRDLGKGRYMRSKGRCMRDLGKGRYMGNGRRCIREEARRCMRNEGRCRGRRYMRNEGMYVREEIHEK